MRRTHKSRCWLSQVLSRPAAITPAKIECHADALRSAIYAGDIAPRKTYLRMFVDRVVVGEQEVRLTGPTVALAAAASQGV